MPNQLRRPQILMAILVICASGFGVGLSRHPEALPPDSWLPKEGRIVPSTSELRFSVGLRGGEVVVHEAATGTTFERIGGTEHFAVIPAQLSSAFEGAVSRAAPNHPYLALTVTESAGQTSILVGIGGRQEPIAPTRGESRSGLRFWNSVEGEIVDPNYVPAIVEWHPAPSGGAGTVVLRAMDVPQNLGTDWVIAKSDSASALGVQVTTFFVVRR